MADESPVFIPCEICDTPVAIDDYVTHADECNSRRFIAYHGVSLSNLLQPVAPNQPAARQPSRQLFPELDFASNLASGDEEEAEEVDEEKKMVAGEKEFDKEKKMVEEGTRVAKEGGTLGSPCDPPPLLSN